MPLLNRKSKELISESKEKGRRYLTAESPDKLLGIFKRQKQEIKEKEREFIRVIATLRDKYQLDDKKDIETYQSKAGLKTLLNDFSTTQAKKIYVLVSNEKIWPQKARQIIYQKIRKRLGQIKINELSPGKSFSNDYLKKKPFKQKLFSFSGAIIIYDKIIILSPEKSGILIKNKTIINLLKSLFRYLWEV